MAGPGFWVGGDFKIPDKLITQREQDHLRQQLEDINIPLTDKTVNVNANGP